MPSSNYIKDVGDIFIDKIVDLIEADKLDELIKVIKERASILSKDELIDQVSFQARFLSKNKSAVRERRISVEDAAIEEGRIAAALLGIAREIVKSQGPSRHENDGFEVLNADLLTARKQFDSVLKKEASNPTHALEAIHGINNLKSISWLEMGLRASRSVCRIIVSTPEGARYGTGFLIGSNRVMTNNHVIRSKDEALLAVVEFNYQLTLDPHPDTTVRYELNPETFFHTNEELDYSVIAVKIDPKKSPIEKWGKLILNAEADPVRGERIAIIEHPNAQVKQVVFTGSVVVQNQPPLVHYTSDTMGGSSGSPVFNDLWQVIAIHHAAGPTIRGIPTNEGILMSSIHSHLGSHWPMSPIHQAIHDYKKQIVSKWDNQWIEMETHKDFLDDDKKPKR